MLDLVISIYLSIYLYIYMAKMVKNLPTMQKTQVQSLGQEEPLEKGMATHSSILPWRIYISACACVCVCVCV